jgi:hypothetical protein
MIKGMNGMIPEAWPEASGKQPARAFGPDPVHRIHRWFKVLQTPHPAGFLSGTTPFNALIGRRKGASAHCSLSLDPRKFGFA